jgi:hypothetical protein
LYFDFNRLDTLDQLAFQGLIKLSKIKLANNFLSILPGRIFNGLGSLIDIDMINNRILSMETTILVGLINLGNKQEI